MWMLSWVKCCSTSFRSKVDHKPDITASSWWIERTGIVTDMQLLKDLDKELGILAKRFITGFS